ncbi:hypothetical protein [Specibacter cremeus]|uniref:hypothetical protein n=1 Tax=Specibacter cremeus TaxID=1629051 RepID=UPI0013DE5B2C|nr:hypothetical protein [Specibacter cremeus]
MDLPSTKTDRALYVGHVVKHVSNDRQATGMVFGIFTTEPWSQIGHVRIRK